MRALDTIKRLWPSGHGFANPFSVSVTLICVGFLMLMFGDSLLIRPSYGFRERWLFAIFSLFGLVATIVHGLAPSYSLKVVSLNVGLGIEMLLCLGFMSHVAVKFLRRNR